MSIKAMVFTKDGNKFLIPGFWTKEGDSDRPSLIIDAMMFCITLGLEREKELLTVETDEKGSSDFPHIVIDLLSPHLAHGGVKVLAFAGPLFDEATKGREPDMTKSSEM